MAQPKHTEFAMKALDLADMFKMVFGTKPLQGPVIFAVELGTPDGPSTAGGKQAVQHIKLVPQGEGATTLVMGHANPPELVAELRSYDLLAHQHAQRFRGATLPITREAYEELATRLERFFVNQGMKILKAEATLDTNAAALRQQIESAPTPIPAGHPMRMAAIAGGVLALGAIIFFFVK